jgi:spore coat polysaccharide biosynthesis protein SpsF
MKVVLIVQARVGSTRLPGKVLLPVLGKSMLAHQIDRLRQVRYANNLVIATTDSPKDDAIVDFCKQYGVLVVRGGVNDLLSR